MKRRRPPVPPATASYRAEQIWLEFSATLEALPGELRVVFLLRVACGLSLPDIALITGLSVEACRDQLQRARQRVLERLSLRHPPSGNPTP